MKKSILFIALLATLFLHPACRESPAQQDQQSAIDSLRTVVEQLKPGLGEFMVQVEFHESRLARSIAEKDYARAGFEIDEISEVTEKIGQLKISNDKLKAPFGDFARKYLDAPLQALKEAADKKDSVALNTQLINLVNGCNSCHQENNMPFMRINY